MSMDKFNITYEIITPESVEYGEPEEIGFIAENVSLREGIDELSGGEIVEANCYPISIGSPPRWFTAHNVRENYVTSETENRSLHLPENITPSSALRVARLLGCYPNWNEVTS